MNLLTNLFHLGQQKPSGPFRSRWVWYFAQTAILPAFANAEDKA